MNLLTSMPHSPTYQQVVLGKINQRKIAKGKENKMNSKQSNMKRGKEMKRNVVIEWKNSRAKLRNLGKPLASTKAQWHTTSQNSYHG